MLATQLADRVVVQAPAKINLFLEVLRKRSDGYHEVVTLMVAVSLFDTLEFREGPGADIELTCDDARLPAGPANLVWKAVEVVRRETGKRQGVRIGLTKRIPVGAGLGGGSSDAAATFIGLNALWRLNVPTPEWTRWAGTLGSDVPFFLDGVAARCTGRGELVTPAALTEPLHLVLACPTVELPTARVYQQVEVPEVPRSDAALLQAMATGDRPAIGRELFNRLQTAAERLCPQVAALRELFETLAPVGHLMSGSGSSSFALCRGTDEAKVLAEQLRPRLPDTRVFQVETC